MRRLALLTAASLSFAAIPYSVKADTGSVELSNGQESSLKDDVIFKWYINGQTQGAGVPNSFGIGSLRPFAIQENSLWFFDSVMNVNLGDVGGSSIINTDVAGTTLSSSNRLGYRWLNENNSKMYGFNFGYDTRNMNTGDADSRTVTNKKDVSFQQVALGVETVGEKWNFNGYALVPTGDVEKDLNDTYQGGAMNTYGVDMGFDLTDDLTSSVGYYYQHLDQEHRTTFLLRCAWCATSRYSSRVWVVFSHFGQLLIPPSIQRGRLLRLLLLLPVFCNALFNY